MRSLAPTRWLSSSTIPETLAPFPDAAGNFVTTLSEVEVLGEPTR